MKGDFTRSTFRPEKHYSGVRMQQGRVQLDADWNEQIDIAALRTETAAVDVIGGCGAPMHDVGFSLTNGASPMIGEGRYYVDGILCQNDAKVALDKQPDLPVAGLSDLITPKPKDGAAQDGYYMAYLDVWQRHITALEDEGIREVALGGPDTATRTKTVWQVKLFGPIPPRPISCASEPKEWTDLLDRTQDGKLSAKAEESTEEKKPCVVPPGAGYRRLENQLYRVEIHEVDESGAIKLLKWSRDNGSIVTRWLDQRGIELIVSSIGRDDVLEFAPGQYVEVVDDQRELRGQAGILVKLANAEGQVLTLDGADASAALVNKADFPDKLDGWPNNPKARRWDGVMSNPATDNWLELEDGVQIKLGPGKKYHVGDYWLIPARTAKADVEWPRDTATPPNPIPQPPAGIEHHYCKLAIVKLETIMGRRPVFTVFQDCRKLFPPLTELTTLLYVGGDGQEAMPGDLLPQPLRVRVVNGQAPVIGAQVKFSVTQGGGSLSVAQPQATTPPDGIAECGWTLGHADKQQVTAVLLEAGKPYAPGQILYFGANLSVAQTQTGGGCAMTVGEGGQRETLAEAFKALAEEGKSTWCICLLPGRHDYNGELAEYLPKLRHLSITACSPGAILFLNAELIVTGLQSFRLAGMHVQAEGLPRAMEVTGCANVTLADLEMEIIKGDIEADAIFFGGCLRVTIRDVTTTGDQMQSLMSFEETRVVTLSACRLEVQNGVPLRFGGGAQRIILEDNVLSALLGDNVPGVALVVGESQADTTLSSNIVTGAVSLYGRPDLTSLKPEEWTALARIIRRGQEITLNPGPGTFEAHGNRLTRLVAGEKVMSQLRAIAGAGKGTLDGVLRALLLTENVVETEENSMVAQRLSLTSNHFLHQGDQPIGHVLGEGSTFVGNHATGLKAPELINISQYFLEAANLMKISWWP